MTKENYIKLAELLANKKPLPNLSLYTTNDDYQQAFNVWLRIKAGLIDILKADNYRFNSKKFEDHINKILNIK